MIKKNKSFKGYAALGLIAAPAVVSGMILSSNFASAESSVVDTITAIVPTSCTVSSSGTASHTATIVSGTYTDDIGTTTMNVICNDESGFSIYATGFTGGTIGGANSNKLVGTVASGNATIDTGTATGPGYNDESNWAMRLEPDYYGEYPITILDDYDYYHEVPSGLTKVATRTTGTDSGAGARGATLISTYAAYISKSQPADTYSGQVKFVLVHPNTADVPVSFADAYYSAGKTKHNGYYKMQDMDDTICSNVDESETGVLIDVRDDNTYTVAKIAGRCWMTQNLRFTDTELDYATSNVADSTTITYGDLTSGNSEDEALIHEGVDSDGNPTVWYNYAAASAMTITGSSNSADAVYDVCPAGWRLPNSTEVDSVTPFASTFNPVLGGMYYDGTVFGPGGFWWSATANNAESRYSLIWDGSDLASDSNAVRVYGFYVKCIKK